MNKCTALDGASCVALLLFENIRWFRGISCIEEWKLLLRGLQILQLFCLHISHLAYFYSANFILSRMFEYNLPIYQKQLSTNYGSTNRLDHLCLFLWPVPIITRALTRCKHFDLSWKRKRVIASRKFICLNINQVLMGF